MKHASLLLIVFLICQIHLVSCGGSGVGLDANGDPIPGFVDVPSDDGSTTGGDSGSGSGGGGGGSGGGSGGGGSTAGCGTSGYVSALDCTTITPAFPPTYNDVVANVFEGGISNNCTNCHSGGGAPKGLHLDSANAYNEMVSIKSSEKSSLCRIKPGSPDDSYLVMKIEGASLISGQQMPYGGPYLTNEEICAVRLWIESLTP